MSDRIWLGSDPPGVPTDPPTASWARPRPSARPTAWCRETLTGYKRPKVIEFRSELPKTPVGKVLRRELRGAV